MRTASGVTTCRCFTTSIGTDAFGGGLYAVGARATMVDCTFEANSATGCGGGLFGVDSELDLGWATGAAGPRVLGKRVPA